MFLRAWDRRRTLRNDDSLGAWIPRIAVNVALTRRRGNLLRLGREHRMPGDRDPVDGIPAPDAARALDMESAVTRLPPGARAVFVLHDLEAQTHQEIGAIRGIAESTSKAHLHRAHRLLRREVER